MRRAQPDDVRRIRDVIERAYEKYVDRMDRVPAPVARDYTDAIDDGHLDYREVRRSLEDGYRRVFFEKSL